MSTLDSDDSRGFSRRDAMRTALGAFGLGALGPIDRLAAAVAPPAPVPTDNFLVVVELDGGNDSLNMLVPQGLPSYATQRPNLALPAQNTLALDSGAFATDRYRMHPSMPFLAQLYRDGELAVVQKVGYPQANGSHEQSKLVWATGQREGLLSAASGWIGRYADLEAPSTLGAVSIGRGRHHSFTGGASNPLNLGSMSRFRFEPDWASQPNHRRRLEIVREMLEVRGRSVTRDALQVGHALTDRMEAAVSDYVSIVSYRNRTLSRLLQDVARMVHASFETRIYYTGFGGFDTHAGQGGVSGAHAGLMQTLDEGIEDLVTDLKALGVWDQAVIVVMSEFGRRCFENGSGGTDHGEAGCVLVMGGNVRGGLHGPELTDSDLAADNLAYGLDFRAVYSNLLEGHLGMSDPSRVFGEAWEIGDTVDLLL